MPGFKPLFKKPISIYSIFNIRSKIKTDKFYTLI